ncbi:MAG TPA: HAMP domain-containing sensor histidine kinase [Candidatus Elarobacter sp.]|nr:HAMP domain-containing sensor histidine kinase [Candidatus Elarobacter sp.]
MRSFATRLGAGYAIVGFSAVAVLVLCFAALAFMRASDELAARTHAVALRAAPLAKMLDVHGVRRGAPAFVAQAQTDEVMVVVVDLRSGAAYSGGAWHERPIGEDAPAPARLPFAPMPRLPPERLQTAGATVLFLPSTDALAPRVRTILVVATIMLVAGGVLCSLLARALARTAVRPLHAVTLELERFGAGDLRPAKVGNRAQFDEFARLAKAYETATRRVAAAFARREESEREMRRFVGDAAHELRTPLTIIGGCIDALKNDADAGGRQHTIETLAGEQRRLRVTLDRLLLLMRLDAPELLGADAGAVDVVQCVEERVSAFARAWPDRRVRFAVEPGLDGVAILADEDELRMALDNLVENALKYAPGSTVDVAVRRAGERISLVVRDRGPGLSAADRAHAFDRFYRGSETRGEVQGSGLGLAISQRIAHRHGGSVSIESAPGEGCTVEMRFPAAAWASVL